MQSEFVNILDDIEASSYQPEIKAKLEKATMLLWSLQDVKNGGSGVVNWNGMEIIPATTITPAPITPIAVIPEVIPQVVIEEAPKEIKPKKKKEKVEFDLQKDLNINIDEINFDDLLQGF